MPTASVAPFTHNDTRTETFDVTISDGAGNSAVQTISVIVHGPDGAPVAENDTAAAQPIQPIANGNLLANDHDPDQDTLTVTGLLNGEATATTITVHGTYGDLVVTKATGDYTYTLGATAAEQAARGNHTATDTFTYTADDGHGKSAQANLTVTATGHSVLHVGNGGYSTIQAAINAAAAGDSILIAAGTYQEQLTLDGKHLTLVGAGRDQTIIKSPNAAGLAVNLVDSSRALPNQYAVVGIKNGADVTLEGLTVDGNDQGAVANGGGQFVGIYALNSNLTVDDVHVTKVDEVVGLAASGNQRNHSIVANSQTGQGNRTLTVRDSLIDLFQKTGIFALGATLTAYLLDNEIVGAGPGVQGQNGIQIGSSGAGAATNATITNNTISGIGVTGDPANGVGSGILTFNAGSVVVEDNTITGTSSPNYGVAFVNTEAPVATGNTISSTTSAILDSGTFTTPVTHASNVFVGDQTNLDLEASGTAALTFSGSEGHDLLIGGSGNDQLSGLGGGDTINGAAGTDTAAYSVSLTAANITTVLDADPTTAGNQAGWQVSAGAEGTDLLTNVEKVADGAGHHFLLVGNGGYATIQAAVNAAVAGDTILVGPGTFAGASIGKELTIVGRGSGAGGTIITSGLTQNGFQVTGNIDATAADSTATVTIQGFKFTGNAVGLSISSTTQLSHLVVTNSDFASNIVHGIGTGNGAFGLDAIDITNSTFEQNGNGSHNGDGDIVLFGYTGDALIKNVAITGGANLVPTNANADTAIQINGRNPTSYDVTHPIGNVVFDNVNVTGAYAKVLVYVQGYTDLDGLHFSDTGTTLNGHAGWGYALYVDPTADETSAATPNVPGEPGFFDAAAAGALVPDTVDLSHVNAINDIPLNGTALGEVFSGTPVADNVTGTGGIDLLLGKDGNDTLAGGLGNDIINGGGGTDTAGYSGTLTAANIKAILDANPTTAGNQAGWQVSAGADGTDLLTNVEKVTDGAGHHFLLVGAGGYATIQAAVNAAAAGDTILVAPGTYGDHVDLNKAVTLGGANFGVNGDGARGAESVITGGLKISADGVTVDGVEISGSYSTLNTPDITAPPNIGLLIAGAHVTVENSVFSGDALDSRPFGTTGAAADLSFEHNLVEGWTRGGYLTAGSSGSITDNTFIDNANGVYSEGMSFFVSGNTFTGSAGADVSGYIVSANFNVGAVVHDNTYSSDLARPINVYLFGPDGQTVNGSDVATTFHLEYHTGSATVHGGAGSDAISYSDDTAGVTINLNTGTASGAGGTATFTSIENAVGGSGDDTLTGKGNGVLEGGPGDDHIVGHGDGTDTASYEHATAGVTVDLTHSGPRDTGGAGVDSLSNISNLIGSQFNDHLTGDNGNNVLDAGLGGFDTLTGNAGNDAFVFHAGALTVTDFQHGQDRVDVSDFGFTQAQLQTLIDATSPGEHELVLEADATITFEGVDVHQLQASSDFIVSHGPRSA